MSSIEEINREIEKVGKEIGEIQTKIDDWEKDGNNYKLDLLNQNVYLIFLKLQSQSKIISAIGRPKRNSYETKRNSYETKSSCSYSVNQVKSTF